MCGSPCARRPRHEPPQARSLADLLGAVVADRRGDPFPLRGDDHHRPEIADRSARSDLVAARMALAELSRNVADVRLRAGFGQLALRFWLDDNRRYHRL